MLDVVSQQHRLFHDLCREHAIDTATLEAHSTTTLKVEPHSSASDDVSATVVIKAEPLHDAAGLSHQHSVPNHDDDTDDFDFNSFHDLMDAELMSVNELDKLWTNSNPTQSDSSSKIDSASRALSVAGGFDADAPGTHTGGQQWRGADSADGTNGALDDELSSKLTQKLLALSTGSVANVGPAAGEAKEQDSRAVTIDGEKCSDSQQAVLAAAAAVAAATLELPTDIKKDNNSVQQQPAAATATTVDFQPDDAELLSVSKSMIDTEAALSLDAAEGGKGSGDDSASGTGSSSKVILPDPFADISPTAMVATKVPVSPRIVLTIVETVPVYMTVLTTTEPAADCQGKWIVRRHRLLRLVENGYVNASSLLLAGGVASEQERSIVLSLEVGRFKWRRPQSKLYGTWIPLPRARALAATCSLNHRLGPFLNDNLEAYFPAPLPTSFIRHLIMPFFNDPASVLLASQQPGGAHSGSGSAATPSIRAPTSAEIAESGLGIEFQTMVNSAIAGNSASQQSISRTSTFGATARGTPSPSIIQSLATRPGAFSFAGAAKAIFGSDDRHLQSFLQLLSAESPMLGTSLVAEQQNRLQQQLLHQQQQQQQQQQKQPAKSGSQSPDEHAAMAVDDGDDNEGDGDRNGDDETTTGTGSVLMTKVGNTPEKSPQSATKTAAASSATVSSVVDQGKSSAAPAITGQGIAAVRVTRSTSAVVAAAAAALAASVEQSADSKESSPALISSVSSSTTSAADPTETTLASKPLSPSMDAHFPDDLDLDISMVIPGEDSDVDMICCSTPPSPPPPPSSPPALRKLSTTPLKLSSNDIESDGATSSSSRGTMRKNGQQPTSSLNARLAQTMEAFGFTGTAKANLLLRLRAAAAAKSTGKQQAVAPYLLYRNNSK
ncbi:hypothetical protein EC988_004308, partial [Linderina pennispora]